MKHLVYDVGICNDDRRHAQQVVRELGITRIYDVPQSIGDCWWFLGCENVPDPLPPHFSEMKNFRPHDAIGHGISKEMADKLSAAEQDR